MPGVILLQQAFAGQGSLPCLPFRSETKEGAQPRETPDKSQEKKPADLRAFSVLRVEFSSFAKAMEDK
ncbi:MAG: hypothetical protein CMP59_00210 [Flavobacteriales bacterium]|nr:hypothetical protein [Flavobacteriales bacterium]